MSDVNTTNYKEADMNELKKLQQRLNHESIRYQFRTKLVGGLNEEDVTKYIEDLENKLKKIEQENKKSSDEIYSLKTNLNTELELKDSLQADLDKAKQNLVTAIVEFKQKQMDYKSISEKYNSENIRLKNEIQQIMKEQKTLESIVAEINNDKEQLKQLAVKAEEDNKILNSKIFQLEEEQTHYNNIKNQNIKVTKEKKEIEELLNQSTIECEQLKTISDEIKDENNLLQIRIAEMTEENIHIDKLKNENIQMSQELKAYEELLNQASIEYEQLEANANNIKSENMLLNKKIISLQQTINEKLKELDEQKKINEDAALELSMVKADFLNYKINGFKEEFESIYEKMENLEHEAKQSSKLGSILKQQLVIQQNRAEKAENDLAKIIELLTQVGDKFNNKSDILGDEFVQLIEKQKLKRPQINDKIINL